MARCEKAFNKVFCQRGFVGSVGLCLLAVSVVLFMVSARLRPLSLPSLARFGAFLCYWRFYRKIEVANFVGLESTGLLPNAAFRDQISGKPSGIQAKIVSLNRKNAHF